VTEHLDDGRRKIKQLKDNERGLVDELQRIEKEGDKQSKLQRMRQSHDEKKDRIENAVASDQKIRRVLGREIDLQVRGAAIGGAPNDVC
jgi:DNA repair exonuclease SbcCD ATPase subunit